MAFGEDYARTGNNGFRLTDAAYYSNMATIRTIVEGLRVGIAMTNLKDMVDVALVTFVNFIDPRAPFPALYCASQENRPQAVRLLVDLLFGCGRGVRRHGWI